MIQSVDGSRLTPKQKASEILADSISVGLSYWQEKDHYTDGMTSIEKSKVDDQLKKQADRLVRLLGYIEAWYS